MLFTAFIDEEGKNFFFYVQRSTFHWKKPLRKAKKFLFTEREKIKV